MTTKETFRYHSLHIDQDGYLVQLLEQLDENNIPFKLKEEKYGLPVGLGVEGLKRIDI